MIISGMNNNNTSSSKSEVVDDQMFMFSQTYSNVGVTYAPMVHTSAQPGDKKVKRRRRRKKISSKACNGTDGSETALRKRKLTEEQVNMLEMNFGNEHKLESERKDRLAAELGLDPRQVAVWFQNRRARWKTKKLDEEYSKLKSAHDCLVLRNCQLESQVMKLEERLGAAESEVRRMTTEKYSEGTTSSNSPMSCLSMEAMEAVPFMGGTFGMIEESLQNVFYLPEDNYAPGYIEWANLYL